jgi:phenylacetate-CoA ligase
MVRQILRGMLISERRPPAVREVAQRARLHSLLVHAASHVPFYAERLHSADFRPDRPLTEEIWRRLPVITRHEVQCSAERLKARAMPRGHGPIAESHTSGSTGIPLCVLKTGLSRLFWDAVTARDMIWQQRKKSRPWHAIRYVEGDSASYPNGSTSTSWGRVAHILGQTGPGFGLNIMTDPFDQIEWLRRNPPSYLLTYPSNLKALLQATDSQGVVFPQLKQVITVAESLPGGLRQQCREQWGARICDLYSAAEVGYIAIQAPKGDHYLVPEEVVRVELLDDAGDPVAPGESGRVVVTPLHNYAMPLIRYDIGDYARRGARSSCGRTLPVIEQILGRVRNMLVYPDGRKIWPSFQAGRFREIAPVRQYRVIQRASDRLELQVAAERVLSEHERAALADMLLGGVQHPFHVDVTEHAKIARSAGGKYEDFRNEVPAA